MGASFVTPYPRLKPHYRYDWTREHWVLIDWRINRVSFPDVLK
jgi:hypothetical protein